MRPPHPLPAWIEYRRPPARHELSVDYCDGAYATVAFADPLAGGEWETAARFLSRLVGREEEYDAWAADAAAADDTPPARRPRAAGRG